MLPLYPEAIQIPFNGNAGGPYVIDAPFRGVLHTTESVDFSPSTLSYYGHSNPPHFTLARKSGHANVYQHYSINVAARALANEEGGVQTNRECAIQIEIAWRAANIGNLPPEMKEALKELMRWISAQAHIQMTAPAFFGEEAHGAGSVSRMSFSRWRAFNGWCGHQHVPENVHWDPGKIDIDYLLAP